MNKKWKTKEIAYEKKSIVTAWKKNEVEKNSICNEEQRISMKKRGKKYHMKKEHRISMKKKRREKE